MCFSYSKTYKGHKYVVIEGAHTMNESAVACKGQGGGALAIAYSNGTFNALRQLYDQYQDEYEYGLVVGMWLDGRRDDEAAGVWRCESDTVDCGANMPWSAGEPNRLNTEHCVVVWHSRTDGVANYVCTRKLPAICEET